MTSTGLANNRRGHATRVSPSPGSRSFLLARRYLFDVAPKKGPSSSRQLGLRRKQFPAVGNGAAKDRIMRERIPIGSDRLVRAGRFRSQPDLIAPRIRTASARSALAF